MNDQIDEDIAKNIGISIDTLKENYPNLYKDFVENSMNIDNIQDNSQTEQEAIQSSDRFRNYNPNYRDFLARATSIEECEEIINYLLEQNEINQNLAEELRILIRKEDSKIFGLRKGSYYSSYLR
jgi:hypothetical protein